MQTKGLRHIVLVSLNGLCQLLGLQQNTMENLKKQVSI